MKKDWLKKIAGAVLVFSLTLTGFTGCAGKTGDPLENAALAKENVYRLQEFDIPDFGGDDATVRGSYHADGMLYMLVQVYHWDEDNYLDLRLLSMQDGSTEMQMTTLETSLETSGDQAVTLPQPRDIADDTDAADTEADAGAEPADVVADADAVEDTETETDTEVDIDSDSQLDFDADYDEEIIGGEVYEYSGYNSFVFSDDRLFGIKYHNYEDYTDPYNSIFERNSYVCCWDMTGSLLWESDLELQAMETEEESFWVSTLMTGADNSVDIILMGNGPYCLNVDADGNVGNRTKFPDEFGEILNRYYQMIPMDDGKLLMMYDDMNDWKKQYFVLCDVKTKQLGEPVRVPDTFAYTGFSALSPGLNSDLLYCTREGVFSYNLGDEEGTPKMNFINSDIEINYFDTIYELDDNSFVGIFSQPESGDMAGGIFTYVKPEDIPDKKVLVLAGNDPDYQMRKRVIEFNRNSDEYRITIKSYNSYNTYEDYYAGFAQLDSDIITGNMPDILIMSGQSVDKYVSKGLLADIGKLIKNDAGLSNVEFVDNVFDAYSIDGKLYQVIPQFNVRTMLAKEAIVGDRTSWTMEDMYQLQNSQPEGTKMFGDLTRDYFFNLVMTYAGSDLVDVNTGKCNFNSPEFIAMMEYAKTLPEEIVYDDNYWMSFNYESQYRENKTLLCEVYVYSVADMNYTVNGLFGEDISFIGFPTDNGQGSVISLGETYCISAKSANQDAAWEFLRYYLTDEYQDEIGYSLPIQKDNFEAKAQEALNRPYYIDYETGEKIEYDEAFFINGEEIKLPPMSQEQVDEIVNMIYSIEKPSYSNQDVLNIIQEEIGGFYSGQKSAQEVAGVIQSRVQIYVAENR